MFVFLFTDIEGSSKLWEEHTGVMTPVIARHDEILREQVEAAGGRITKHTGDGITAVFEGGQPVACALQAQVRFAAEPWGEIGELRIRAGLHAGEAEFHPSAGTAAGDYFGPPVNATARVMSAAWGGQVLLTPQVTQVSPLPPQATLLDLGQHLLKNVSAPQQLYQLDHPQLPWHQFPPPRTLSGRSIEQAVDERGGQMAALEPQAMGIALLTATLLPALQGELDPKSGALEGNLGVLDDLGAPSLRGFVASLAERLRTGKPLPAPEVQALLQGELQAQWQAGDETALALRTDASRLLQAVHGVEAAMAAASDEVKEALARGLADLGAQFDEFRWMLAGVRDTLAEMRARQALQLALQREQLDLQRQQLVKTNLILHQQQLGPQRAELSVSGEVDEESPADVPCPYKGLAAFEAQDAEYFYGREELVAELTARLAGTGFLTVVGPSGSGKSSLVRAGLLPAVWAGALPGSEEWQTLVITPGAHPLNELAVRLSVLCEDRPASLLRDLEADPRALELAVRRALADEPDGVKLLLVVDQFEEIFALCRDEQERRQFIDALLYAVEAEDGRAVVVPTVRADFYGRCAEYPALAARMGDGLLVGPMSEAELRQAIEQPAAVVGLHLEPGLADTVVDDVAGEPGALPLLSHALLETFARRRGHTMTLAGYAASGGVAGAIAQTADTVYGGLDAGEQALARSIFLRLTELGEEGAQDTRRRVAPGELVRSEEEGPEVEALLRTLADARLITTGEDSVEVAHEALIREWPLLRGWLEEDREGLRVHRHLTEAAGEWERLGREEGELYRGARLAAAGEWAEAHREALNPLEREFLAASRELAEREAAEREAQRQRELEAARALAAEQEKRADAERRRAQEQAHSAGRLRRRALLLAGAMVVAVILAALAFVAFRQADESANAAQVASTQAVSERYAAEAEAEARATQQAVAVAEAEARATQQAVAEAEAEARATQQAVAVAEAEARATQQAIAEEQRAVAEEQRRLATSRELANAAVLSLDEDPERSALLALEALEAADTLEAQNALRWALPEMRMLHTLPVPGSGGTGVAFSPDGALLAAALEDGVMVWDAASAKELFFLDRPLWGHPRVTFSPDGTRLFASGESDLYVWEMAATDTGAVTATNPITVSGYLTKTSGYFTIGVNFMSFSPDGQRMAVAHWKGAPAVFDTATLTETLRLEGHAVNCRDVAFSPDGRLLATAGDDLTVRVWDAETGLELLNLSVPNPRVYSVDWSPDGSRLVAADQVGMMIVWDPLTGEKLLTKSSGVAGFFGVSFADDGRSLVTPMTDGTVREWDAETGDLVKTYAGHMGSAQDVAISSDGTLLATAGTDGTVRLWTRGPVGEINAFSVGPGAGLTAIDYSPDGKQVATNSAAGPAIWDPLTGERVLALPQVDESGGSYAVAYSPDGKRLATGTLGGPIHIWGLPSGEHVQTLTGHRFMVANVTFSPDGQRLASAGLDGLAAVWDLASGQAMTLTLNPDLPTLFGLSFSPDGSQVATASPMEALERGGVNGIHVWDAVTGTALYTITIDTAAVYGACYSPDGELIAASVQEGKVFLYDTSSRQLVRTLSGHTGLVWRLAFSPDGKILTSASHDMTVKVWDVDTGAELATLDPGTSFLNGLALSPDGRRVATASVEGTVHIFALSTEELVEAARSRVTRSLTTLECQKYLHVEECPEQP
jgi:WD40 repeat protein/class 3 adenylate cyclase